jgi:hypothetical protein
MAPVVGVDVYRGSDAVPGTLWVPAEIDPPWYGHRPGRADEDVRPYDCIPCGLIVHWRLWLRGYKVDATAAT